MQYKDRRKTPRKPKRIRKTRYRPVRTGWGPRAELSLLPARPVPASCHSAFCPGKVQGKATMQNYHDAMFQRRKSPTALKCKDGGNMT